MKAITLRTIKSLPPEYVGVKQFFVRIGGVVSECRSLHDAQMATAHWPQHAPVTFFLRDPRGEGDYRTALTRDTILHLQRGR